MNDDLTDDRWLLLARVTKFIDGEWYCCACDIPICNDCFGCNHIICLCNELFPEAADN